MKRILEIMWPSPNVDKLEDARDLLDLVVGRAKNEAIRSKLNKAIDLINEVIADENDDDKSVSLGVVTCVVLMC
jgi:hypothetical protein